MDYCSCCLLTITRCPNFQYFCSLKTHSSSSSAGIATISSGHELAEKPGARGVSRSTSSTTTADLLHLGPHVASTSLKGFDESSSWVRRRAYLAEVSFDYQMRVEILYVRVEKRERDDTGDDRRRRHCDGEEGDPTHRPLLVRLALLLHLLPR